METIDTDFYTGDVALKRLRKLATFHDIMAEEFFQFCHYDSDIVHGRLVANPSFEYSDTVEHFIRLCVKDGWIIPEFDWRGWSATPGAQAYFVHPSGLDEVEPLMLAKVLTVIFGREHAHRGYLIEAYETGLLVKLLRRANTLTTTQPFPAMS